MYYMSRSTLDKCMSVLSRIQGPLPSDKADFQYPVFRWLHLMLHRFNSYSSTRSASTYCPSGDDRAFKRALLLRNHSPRGGHRHHLSMASLGVSRKYKLRRLPLLVVKSCRWTLPIDDTLGRRLKLKGTRNPVRREEKTKNLNGLVRVHDRAPALNQAMRAGLSLTPRHTTLKSRTVSPGENAEA